LNLQGGSAKYADPQTAWFYANAIGLILIQSVELEIDGVTIEKVDGDFSTVYSQLFPEFNTQFGVAEHVGLRWLVATGSEYRVLGMMQELFSPHSTFSSTGA
jgi:hypothetical protein